MISIICKKGSFSINKKKLTKKARGDFSDSSECMSVSYCMLTVVIWWCLCCYLLIIYCNKLYKSFCFWWWNRNEKQKYNTDINICTNKSRPFIHETGSGTCIIHCFGSKKLAPFKNFSWLLNWLLTSENGTWQFFWLLLLGSQSSPCNGLNNSSSVSTSTSGKGLLTFSTRAVV